MKRIQRCDSVSLYPQLKGDDFMKNLLVEHTFQDCMVVDILQPVPVIVTQDNGDGTYQGYLDLDKMSAKQRIVADMFSH